MAVGLSQSLICGGAIGALLINATERHPHSRARPLVDYGLAAFLSPAEMAGAQIGVVLNQALPSPVILATMACVLSVLAHRTIKKGRAALRSEREAAARARGAEVDEGAEEKGMLLQRPSSEGPPGTSPQLTPTGPPPPMPPASPAPPPPSPPPSPPLNGPPAAAPPASWLARILGGGDAPAAGTPSPSAGPPAVEVRAPTHRRARTRSRRL